jgi:cytochrome P450
VLNRSPGFDGCPSPRSDSVTVCSKVIETRYWQPKIRISDYHLGMEIFDFFMAGTELPANAISFSVFRVARNPLIIERLRQELHDVGFLVNCNFQSLTVLEKLPFLNAVVKETLRLGNLVPGRLPRVTPPEGMSVAGQHIPGGSVVSASTHLVHMNPSIFPEPEKFMPERWLDDTPGRFKLEKYLVAFSSGGRDCVGRELGFAEIRVFIACLVSFFDLELANREDYFLDLGWRDNLVSSYERDVLVAIREKK